MSVYVLISIAVYPSQILLALTGDGLRRTQAPRYSGGTKSIYVDACIRGISCDVNGVSVLQGPGFVVSSDIAPNNWATIIDITVKAPRPYSLFRFYLLFILVVSFPQSFVSTCLHEFCLPTADCHATNRPESMNKMLSNPRMFPFYEKWNRWSSCLARFSQAMHQFELSTRIRFGQRLSTVWRLDLNQNFMPK